MSEETIKLLLARVAALEKQVEKMEKETPPKHNWKYVSYYDHNNMHLWYCIKCGLTRSTCEKEQPVVYNCKPR